MSVWYLQLLLHRIMESLQMIRLVITFFQNSLPEPIAFSLALTSNPRVSSPLTPMVASWAKTTWPIRPEALLIRRTSEWTICYLCRPASPERIMLSLDHLIEVFMSLNFLTLSMQPAGRSKLNKKGFLKAAHS